MRRVAPLLPPPAPARNYRDTSDTRATPISERTPPPQAEGDYLMRQRVTPSLQVIDLRPPRRACVRRAAPEGGFRLLYIEGGSGIGAYFARVLSAILGRA